MDLKTLIPHILRISIILVLVSYGLKLIPKDLIYMIKKKPAIFIRSLISIYIVMPVFAAVLVSIFHLDPAVKVAILTLSLSPTTAAASTKGLGVGGHMRYIFGLLVTVAVLSIAFIPAGVEAFRAISGRDTPMSPLPVATTVIITILAPLAVGIIFRHLAPKISEKIERPVSKTGSILLLSGLILLIISVGPASIKLLVASLGEGTLAVIIGFILVGLISGYILGGPQKNDRAVLALFTSSRHPGVAMAIAATNMTEEVKDNLFPAILIYLLLNTLVEIPFMIWVKSNKKPYLAEGDS